MNFDIDEIRGLINSELTLDQSPDEFQEECSELEDLLKAIEKRVAELIDRDSGLLFSYLYRLDVQEHAVRQVMNDDKVNTVTALSQLILDRQLMRLHTKKTIHQKPIKGWEW